MKHKLVLLSLSILLFTSCMVKSIQPFYVKNAEAFNEELIGKWTDNKKGSWEILSFKEEWYKENKDQSKISLNDKKVFEQYKNSYYLKHTEKENEAVFIAMPFKVNKHLFIDFTPFDIDADDLNKFAGQHLLKTHSTAYLKINEDKSITLKWLSEKAINNLIENKKLRIKHEITGVKKDLILTAKSEELHNFLKKFMQTDFENKWDNDDIYILKSANAKP